MAPVRCCCNLNSLALGWWGCNLKLVFFKVKSRIDISSLSSEIAPRWMPQDLTDDKSTLVQVMAWCRQATLNKPLPEPMLTQISVTIWCHKTTMSWISNFQTRFKDRYCILSISCEIAVKWMPQNFIDDKLTHWGRVTLICVGNLTITASDNGLSPGRRQAIIWTNAGILLIGPLGTNFSEILIEIHIFSFKKMRLKVSSAKWRPFCFSLNVLTMFQVMTWHHQAKKHYPYQCWPNSMIDSLWCC